MKSSAVYTYPGEDAPKPEPPKLAPPVNQNRQHSLYNSIFALNYLFIYQAKWVSIPVKISEKNILIKIVPDEQNSSWWLLDNI